MTVLVGYASAHGSTRGIAERIATRLTEHGCPAEAVSLDRGADPEAYTAVVLGSAVHSRRWLPVAEEFVRTHRDALALPPSLRGHRLLSGAVVPGHVGRIGALMFRLLGGRFGDYRDWEAIDAWSGEIATALGPGALAWRHSHG